MHESLVKFSQIYETATPLELQELLPKFVEKITWKATEIEIALFNREEERGQSSTTPSNHSGGGALDVIKWLPREDSAIRPPEAASWPANFLSPRGLFLPSVGENWLRVLLTLQMKRPTDKLWAFSNWLPREDSNLGHSGYDLTSVTRRVGLSHYHGLYRL